MRRASALVWRRVAAAILAVGLLALGLSAGLRLWVDADVAERQLARRLSGPGREATVSVARAEASLVRRTARMDGVSIVVSDTGGDPSSTVELEAESVELEGASLTALAFGDELRARRLVLRRPSVHVVRSPASGDSAPARPGAGEDAPPGRNGGRPAGLRARLDEALPAVSLGRLEVEDGRLVLSRRSPGDAGSSSESGGAVEHLLEDLSLRLREVSVGGGSDGEASGEHLAGGGELGLGRYRGLLKGEGTHELEIRGVAASLDGDSARVDSLRLLPLPDEETFLRRLEYRTDRIHLVSGPVVGRGVDLRALLDGSAVLARRISIRRPKIAVLSDRRLPLRPGSAPPTMPNERIRDAPIPIAVDTVTIEGGRVEYSERSEASSRPGRVGFEDVHATLVGIANDSGGLGPGGAAVVSVEARLFGAAPLRAEFRFPLLAPDLDFSFRGGLDSMDLRSFNDAFVPLDGMRLESGTLDTLSFDATVRDGVAAGTLEARYRELDLVKVDPEDGGQSLTDLVETLIIEGEVRDANPTSADEPPRTGTIENRRLPADPFFKFLWESVRSGLLSCVRS